MSIRPVAAASAEPSTIGEGTTIDDPPRSPSAEPHKLVDPRDTRATHEIRPISGGTGGRKPGPRDCLVHPLDHIDQAVRSQLDQMAMAGVGLLGGPSFGSHQSRVLLTAIASLVRAGSVLTRDRKSLQLRSCIQTWNGTSGKDRDLE